MPTGSYSVCPDLWRSLIFLNWYDLIYHIKSCIRSLGQALIIVWCMMLCHISAIILQDSWYSIGAGWDPGLPTVHNLLIISCSWGKFGQFCLFWALIGLAWQGPPSTVSCLCKTLWLCKRAKTSIFVTKANFYVLQIIGLVKKILWF